MFTQYYLLLKLRPIFIMNLACCFCLMALSQNAIPVKNILSGPNNHKTFVLTDADQVKVSPPPGKEQTQQELIEFKKKMSQQDEKTLQQIHYWNAGSPAYRWNQIGYQLISFENFGTFVRTPTSWMNMAIYDATLVALKAKNNYKRKRPSQADPSLKPVIASPSTFSYPCEHTVTAAAAANVLAYFYPEKADSILKLAKEAAQSRIYAGVQFPSDMTEGWKLGEEVGKLVIEQAKKDGSDKQWTGKMNTDPKLWKGDYPVGVMVGTFKPIVLKSGDQFRPPAPPDFSEDMKELKNFKRNFESDHLALFWAARTGYDVWTELANQKIFEYRLDNNTLACNRIYTLLHVAMHDAAIAIMDAKYAYWGIRPFQYDTTYLPLIFTPPFPGYPSGHATASSTAATVLSYFFPADAELFRKTAQECADSRFYAGIHFKIDNEVGLQLGKKLGEYIIDSRAKPVNAK